jgi:hypothetical protein
MRAAVENSLPRSGCARGVDHPHHGLATVAGCVEAAGYVGEVHAAFLARFIARCEINRRVYDAVSCALRKW